MAGYKIAAMQIFTQIQWHQNRRKLPNVLSQYTETKDNILISSTMLP